MIKIQVFGEIAEERWFLCSREWDVRRLSQLAQVLTKVSRVLCGMFIMESGFRPSWLAQRPIIIIIITILLDTIAPSLVAYMLSTSSGSILSYYKWESCPLLLAYMLSTSSGSILSYYKWGSYVVFFALSTRHCGSQIPTCASIWPYPSEIILGFSAASILTFYWNNHLLQVLTQCYHLNFKILLKILNINSKHSYVK